LDDNQRKSKFQDMVTVVHIIPNLRIGGAERLLLGLLSQWRDASAKHVVCVLGFDNEFPNELNSFRGNPRIEFIFGLGASLASLPSAVLRIRGIVAKHKNVTVHGWLYIGSLVAGLVGFKKKTPIVWGIHASDFRLADIPVVSRAAIIILKLLRLWPNKIVYCASNSREFHQRYLSWPEGKGYVIQNGIDIARVSGGDREAMRCRLSIPASASVVLYLGRAAPQKGLDTLANAWSESGKKWLILAGPGKTPWVPKLFSTAATVNIRYLAPSEEIRDLLAASDCLVLPSRFGEAMPLVVLESLASGLPVVASVGAATREMASIFQQTGGITLYAPTKPQQLTEALDTVLSEAPCADHVKEWRKIICDQFTVQHAALHYADLYDQLNEHRAR
jgi:glycosyltransferase involved in cell wall biosynthesis